MEVLNELESLREEVTLLRKEKVSLKAKVTRLSAENQRIAEILKAALERNTELEKILLKAAEKFLNEDLYLVSNSFKNNKTNTKTIKRAKNSDNDSWGEENIRSGSVVYFVHCEPAKAIKIGTSKDVRSRLSSIQTGNPFKLFLIGCIPGCVKEERILHNYFDELRATGEWFFVSDRLMKYVIDVTNEGNFIHPCEWFKPDLFHLKSDPYVLDLFKRKKTSLEKTQEIISQAEAYISSLAPAPSGSGLMLMPQDEI